VRRTPNDRGSAPCRCWPCISQLKNAIIIRDGRACEELVVKTDGDGLL
jgi:hypothetical protein